MFLFSLTSVQLCSNYFPFPLDFVPFLSLFLIFFRRSDSNSQTVCSLSLHNNFLLFFTSVQLSSSSSSRLLTVLTEGQKKSLTKGPVDRSLFITCVGGGGLGRFSVNFYSTLFVFCWRRLTSSRRRPPSPPKTVWSPSQNPPSSHFQRKYGFVTHISACLHVSVTHGTELSSAAPGSAGYHLWHALMMSVYKQKLSQLSDTRITLFNPQQARQSRELKCTTTTQGENVLYRSCCFVPRSRGFKPGLYL